LPISIIGLIELPRIFDYIENRHRLVVLHSDAKLDKFKRFVEFVQTKCREDKRITPKKIVSKEDCPVKDQETAKEYLDLMMKTGFDLKSKYRTTRKEYFLGCTPEEDARAKRKGFEGWMGLNTAEFFQRHILAGSIVLERVYRLMEYGDPPFPVLAKTFPCVHALVNDILTGRADLWEFKNGIRT
jgi:hypothetical protein